MGIWDISCEIESRWHPTPLLLPGKSHGRRSLVGCSPWPSVESCSGWQACGVLRGSRAELLSIELDGSSRVVGRVEDLQDSKTQCPGLECIK